MKPFAWAMVSKRWRFPILAAVQPNGFTCCRRCFAPPFFLCLFPYGRVRLIYY